MHQNVEGPNHIIAEETHCKASFERTRDATPEELGGRTFTKNDGEVSPTITFQSDRSALKAQLESTIYSIPLHNFENAVLRNPHFAL